MKEKEIITLFSKDSKGKLRQWQVKFEGDSYFQCSGQVGMKITDWIGVQCKAKNIGKANGTTAEQQAKSEAENKIGIKLKEGYYYTKEEAENDSTFTPMLAEKYEDYKDKIHYPQITQPKLDGARCNIYMKDGKIVCRTRSNRDYVSVPHLIEQFKPILEKHPTFIIDGELYNSLYADNFEDLMSLIRQSKPGTEDLKRSRELVQYHVYDVFDTADPKCNNMGRIQNCQYLADNFGITFVGHNLILKKEEVESALNNYLEQGFEGMMLRNPDGIYKANGRSKDLLKCKIFSDEEFEIVDVLEGNGQWKNCAKKVTIKLNDTDTCEASLKGTQEQLAKVLQNKYDYISKMVTVTFFGRTNTNSLRFPVVKDINGRHDL